VPEDALSAAITPLPADKYYARAIKRNYGLSWGDYTRLLQSQNSLCAICMTPHHKRLHVDHCHETGRVRGLLCGPCNTALGKYEVRRAEIDAYLTRQEEA
jgi:hypothetical protein